VIEALVKLIDAPIVGREVNIGSGKASSINEIIRYIEQATGKPTRHQYLPARPFDVPVSELDVSFARTTLDWSPKVSVFEGICRTISWMKQSVRQDD
jgi:UDP-glucose 4-epimerase